MKNHKKLLLIFGITIIAVLAILSIIILNTNKRSSNERDVIISDFHMWYANIEIIKWKKNGFVGKNIDTNENVRIDLVTERGTIMQPDGSVYPNCRYNIGRNDTSSREYNNSRMRDNWFLSAYGEWEGKQYDVGDIVYIEAFNEGFIDEDGYKYYYVANMYPKK